MNRNHLALFQAVAQTGGITQAAVAVRVSQPAVSKQISELENALGVRLLNRLPRGCELTEAGRLLAGYANQWIQLEHEAERAIEEYRGLKRGRLTIGASLTIGAYLLPDLLAEFHRRHPSIELKVEVANTEKIQRALQVGSLDVALTEGPMRADELTSKVFWEDELVAIAPAGHALLKKKKVTARELVREPILLREEGSGTRSVVEQAFLRKGIRLKPLMELGSPEAIKNLVTRGMGVAVVSRLIIEKEWKAGLLGIVELSDIKIWRPLRRETLTGRAESPALQNFLQLLGEVSRRHAVPGSDRPATVG